MRGICYHDVATDNLPTLLYIVIVICYIWWFVVLIVACRFSLAEYTLRQ